MSYGFYKMIGLTYGMAGMLIAGGVLADTTIPEWSTAFSYSADYLGSGRTWNSTDYSTDAKIVMPAGNRWTCEKKRAVVRTDGKLAASINCWQGTSMVMFVAVCAADKEDVSVHSGIISDLPYGTASAVHLSMVCLTRKSVKIDTHNTTNM